MKKNYVSNSEESIQLFKNPVMNSLSKVHFTVPLFVFIPIISFFVYLAFKEGIGLIQFSGAFALGVAVWTITEYVLHRFVFHFHPTSDFGKRIIFIFHGVHHDYPRDRLRLVMPPSASIPLATLFFLLFSAFISKPFLYGFFPGFLLGYLIYDMMHYAMHHFNYKGGWFKKIKQHHMLHHYQDPEKGFGVSSALWDQVLHTGFENEKTA